MITFDRSQLAGPAPKLLDFAHELAAAEDSDDIDKRQRQRFQMATFVPAVRLNERMEPAGEPFMVMTKNISTTGIALVYTLPISDEMIAVELTGAAGERIQIALQIVRCRELGELYEIGCRYYRRLGSSRI